MKLNHSLSAALSALMLAGGMTAASAQGIVGTSGPNAYYFLSIDTTPLPAIAGGFYTYSYKITDLFGPSTVNSFTFNFGNVPDVTFVGVTGSGSFVVAPHLYATAPFMFSTSVPGGGLIAATGSDTATFTFTSSYAPVADSTSLSSTGSSPSAAGGNTTMGPSLVAAPEPSQTAALGLGVLGLTGMAFTARRRKSLVG